MNIILASSSAYRKNLLKKLITEFECMAPNIDESIHSNESAQKYVERLALEKALAVTKIISDTQRPALVIGSDQCAILNNKIISKPNSPDAAFEQLKDSSGETITFYTGLCVFNTKTNSQQVSHETYQVTFRNLDNQQIKNYLEKDQPYDCAGSFKSEGLGIALFEKMQGDDPSTLIGLPLIKLSSILRSEGYDVLA